MPTNEPLARLDQDPGAPAAWLGAAAILDQIPDGVIVADPEGRIVFVNEAAEHLHGMKKLGVGPADYARAYSLWTLSGEPFPAAELPLARATRGETVSEARWRIRRPDGRDLVAIGSARPFYDSSGNQHGAILTLRDDSARHAAELGLAESEARFRTIADCAPAPVWVTGPNGVEFANRAYSEFAMRPVEELLGHSWVGFVHEEDIPGILALRSSAWETGSPYAWEARFRRSDGEWLWIHASCAPRFGLDGKVQGYVGMAVDVTESRRAEAELRDSERHLRLMVDELNHRVKNTLAIVQGLAQQSFRGGGVSEEVRSSFEGRLAALAAAHDLLTRRSWEGAELGELVVAVVAAHRSDRVAIDGPPLELSPKLAVTLALALHELCTNAVKYGALSVPGGRVSIAWECKPDRLALRWRESGGPPVAEPRRRGFGTRMIERALASETGGRARLEFRRAGVVCEIEAALPPHGPPGEAGVA
ncbi:MAG TPA: PAS domain S-box protein [Allosphingosinicella sp.]|jgi:PAS domain S-box-containing protein